MSKNNNEEDPTVEEVHLYRAMAKIDKEAEALWLNLTGRVRQLWWVPAVCVVAVGVALQRLHMLLYARAQDVPVEAAAVLFLLAFVTFTTAMAGRELYVWWRMVRLFLGLQRLSHELRAIIDDSTWNDDEGHSDG